MASRQSRQQSTVKLDSLNRKILTLIQYNADITNTDLAEQVGLSPAACSKRVSNLRQAGLLVGFHAEVDLNRMCEHVLAYVEFTLHTNDPATRQRFSAAINELPEFMDCLRLSGDVDYISFTCCRDVKALNQLCDTMASDTSLGIKKINTRIIVERAKWFLGYPIDRLKWLQESDGNG